MSVHVSTMVFTLNEEINLPACLQSLSWCDDVIVVDSFSSDGTERVSREYGARFVRHAFTGFGDQRNWALSEVATKHEWVLILDADERVPEDLAAEIARETAAAPDSAAAFMLKRRFHLWGKWLKHSSLYPTWVVRLVRKGRVRYVNRGHAETQEVEGRTLELRADLIDENLKDLEAWYERQARYAEKEALYEISLENASRRLRVDSSDPLERRAALKAVAARLPLRPLLYFLYSYVWRLGALDGPEGLRFCLMKAGFQRAIVREKKRIHAGGGS